MLYNWDKSSRMKRFALDCLIYIYRCYLVIETRLILHTAMALDIDCVKQDLTTSYPPIQVILFNFFYLYLKLKLSTHNTTERVLVQR